jgi:hypothetical protein
MAAVLWEAMPSTQDFVRPRVIGKHLTHKPSQIHAEDFGIERR